MKRINDLGLLQKLMERHEINEYFSTENLSFQLFQYEKGELIIRPDEPLDYVMFVVDGSVKIYAVRMDGTQNAVNMASGFIILGETEVLTDSDPIFFVEAMSDILCITVSMQDYKEDLLNDIKFVRLLARTLTQKFQLITRQETISMTLEEKVMNHIKYHSPDQTIAHMEQTAFQLRCSRRQLQRVLKKLTENGVLKKTAKGKYKLSAETQLGSAPLL